MKIVLGTANFGTAYGISNNKRLSNNQLKEIIAICKKNSIEFLDTSYNYINSEKKISKFCNKENFKIITKLPESKGDIDIIKKSFSNSLIRLNTNRLYALLTHSQQDLKVKHFKKIYKILIDLKKNKKIKKIGISVYKPHELINIISRFNIDIAEIPFSIFDQRFRNKKILKIIKEKNIKIYCRSIFLQGLIFLDNKILKKKFNGEIKKIIKIKEDFKNDNNKILEHCINFVKSENFVNKIIIGVNSPKQLNQILNCYRKKEKKIKSNYKDYIIKDNNIILPYKWKN